jgi:transcriptional regulator with XRE-family HTH domain
MTFKCPYTEVCRADALQQFADAPELAAIFSQRLQCGERNPDRAHRCAVRLALTEKELPTLGSYIQEQRRAKLVPQAQFAQQVGIDIQALRDLELNKLDPVSVPQRILASMAQALSAPADYLAVLARLTTKAGLPRQGTIFARSVTSTDETLEHQE